MKDELKKYIKPKKNLSKMAVVATVLITAYRQYNNYITHDFAEQIVFIPDINTCNEYQKNIDVLDVRLKSGDCQDVLGSKMVRGYWLQALRRCMKRLDTPLMFYIFEENGLSLELFNSLDWDTLAHDYKICREDLGTWRGMNKDVDVDVLVGWLNS